MAKNKRGNKKGLAVACLLASICGKTGAMEKPVNNKVAVQRTNPEKSSNLKKVLIVGGTIFGLGAFGAGIYGLTKLFGDKEELDNGNQKPVEDPIKKEYFDILRSFYEPNTEYGAEYRCKDDDEDDNNDDDNNNNNILDIQKFYSSSRPKCIEDTDKFLAYCTFALTFGKVSESGEITLTKSKIICVLKQKKMMELSTILILVCLKNTMIALMKKDLKFIYLITCWMNLSMLSYQS